MEGNQIAGLLFRFAKLGFVQWSTGIILMPSTQVHNEELI